MALKPQVYKDPRPAEQFQKFHTRTRARPPGLMYELVRIVLTPLLYGGYRARSISADLVPTTGSLILAPNHFSNLDHFFLAVFLRRKVRFVAKSQLFKGPLQPVFLHGGVFPVRRGHRDEEWFTTSRTVLEEQDGCVAMYCEGGRSRTAELSDSVKPGIGRLALETGATVVPVAIYGSARVRNWKRLELPKVTVQYGEPFRYERVADPDREQQQAVAEEIFAEVRRLYVGLERLGRRGMIQRLREQRRAARHTAPA